MPDSFQNLKITGIKTGSSPSLIVQKKTYYKNLFDKCSNDLSKTWKIIKSLTGKSRGKASDINRILFENRELINNSDIAECFNKYFSEIGSNLEAAMLACNVDTLRYLFQ